MFAWVVEDKDEPTNHQLVIAAELIFGIGDGMYLGNEEHEELTKHFAINGVHPYASDMHPNNYGFEDDGTKVMVDLGYVTKDTVWTRTEPRFELTGLAA